MTTAAQDSRIELIGWDNPRLKMYNHRPVVNDVGEVHKPPGTHVSTVLVTNARYLEPGELEQLRYKQLTASFMPWEPGGECMKRPYPIMPRDKIDKPNPEKGRPYGCPACREASSQTNERPRAAAAEVQAPSVESASIASVAPPEVIDTEIVCSTCGWKPRLKSAKGKPHKDSTRLHWLNLHMVKHT